MSRTHTKLGGDRRLDIQGLRAVAVLVVVAFHAGLPIKGGFVGVDIFFVISGFVITAGLLREYEATGRLSLGRFYLRRFKRLTPALALVVAFTVVGSLFVLSPLGPQQTAAKTALGAMLLAANGVITATTGDYFAAAASGNPLLHTWSLSVEEQFYLVFPLVLLLAWAWARRFRAGRPAAQVAADATALVAMVSFGVAWWALGSQHGVTASLFIGYYGPVGRAWEFAAGAILALGWAHVAGWRHRSVLLASLAGLAGLVALGVSCFVISDAMPFPGPWTLWPVAAALLLILAGAEGANPVSRLLATRPFVLIGDWSYSIYLWHWPLIVFARLMWPGDSTALVIAAVVAMLPAVGSYYLVEGPFRRRAIAGRRIPVAVGAVVLPVLLLGGLALPGSTQYVSLQTAAYHGETNWADHDYKKGGFDTCTSATLVHLVKTTPGYEVRCQQSKPGPNVDFALIGDSHAEQLFIGLKDQMPQRNLMYYNAEGRPSFDNPLSKPGFDYILATPSIRTVLVTSYWHGRSVNVPELTAVLKKLVSSGRRVYITDDIPDFPFEPDSCKYRYSPLVPSQCSTPKSQVDTWYPSVNQSLESVLAAVPQVKMLRTQRYLCSAADGSCSMTRGRDILYANFCHLNVLGSEYVGRSLLRDYPELAQD